MFAGAGGLALGASGAGFHHTVLLEINGDACDTIRANMNSGRNYSAGWPLVEGDVRDYDFNGIEDVDLLAAGVPCQPFSAGGKKSCLLYTSPSPRDRTRSRMPSSA